MVTEQKINQRLEALREYVRILESLKPVKAEQLRTNIDTRAKAERFLQLAIEACIDIAEMIIAQQNLPTPQTSSQAIEILGQEEILDEDFAKNFAKAAGLRNILIHEYIEIDYEQLAEKINNKLEDFDTFAKQIAKFVTS